MPVYECTNDHGFTRKFTTSRAKDAAEFLAERYFRVMAECPETQEVAVRETSSGETVTYTVKAEQAVLFYASEKKHNDALSLTLPGL